MLRINNIPCSQKTVRCRYNPSENKNGYICCKNNLVELMDFIVPLFNRYNVTYFIDYGTLLGSVRNYSFIPHDTDVDISIINNNNDYVKFFKSIQQDINNKNFVFIESEPNLFRLFFSKNNSLHIDFWIRNKMIINDNILYYDNHSIKQSGIFEKDLFPLKKKYI